MVCRFFVFTDMINFTQKMKTVNQPLIFKSVIAFSLMLCISSCNNHEGKRANADTVTSQQLLFDKLVGTWQSENGNTFEQWTKKENGSYQSVVFSVKEKDTLYNEQAKIYKQNENWVFENRVKGQNDGKAVQFISSILNENSVQFSNPAHDFPTDINYTLTDSTTLKAFIIGPGSKDGKDTIPFNYTRVK